jgi:beta-glucosidase
MNMATLLFRRTAIFSALALILGACSGGGDSNYVSSSSSASSSGSSESALPWMTAQIVAEQNAASTDAAKETVATKRAQLLLSAMTLAQKMQQLTGSMPEILPELPQCYGGRHISGISALAIPTFRISNGPVGVGQNDCVSTSIYAAVQAGTSSFTASYTDASSAKATALPSAIGLAASFDPALATTYGGVIATEMNNLALHVFEAPGLNMARIPVLGRNFEYFGEDPFLTGSMGVAEIGAIRNGGLIAMAKHFVGNEQETVRNYISETIDTQVLHELYMLPFEMAVKDGNVDAVMCSYNTVNGGQACANSSTLTDTLRTDWGFTGYVQSDFFAMKSTAATLAAGTDNEMPIPQYWSTTNLTAALTAGTITTKQIDTALTRRLTKMFKAGIFDRTLTQTTIDYTTDGQTARTIGGRAAVLLQNNGALPFASTVQNVVLIGKSSQIYAQQAVAGGSTVGTSMGGGGGSSDVVPTYTVTPATGIANVLTTLGNSSASVKVILVDDANSTATINGSSASFSDALTAAAAADAVVIMTGTISEEGADRVTLIDGATTSSTTATLGAGATPADGMSLDWYVAAPKSYATVSSGSNVVKSSASVAMIKAIMAATSTTAATMAQKTALVLKDNAAVALDSDLVGSTGPAILEAWFPGQEDGNIVADLLFGRVNPSGKLPVTFPYKGMSFLDSTSTAQFPGTVSGTTQSVTYSEMLNMGYRWYDANASGSCTVPASGVNPCVAFPFGYGLSYTSFGLGTPKLSSSGTTTSVSVTVSNTGSMTGAEVVQVYLALPSSASSYGATQPPKRLVGFQRVELAAGASQTVTITFDSAASNHPMSVWSKSNNTWVKPSGSFTVYVGNSSSLRDLTSVGTI